MKTANYRVLHINDKQLVIADFGPWDKFPTISNSAEEVVAELHCRNMLGDRELLYYDSQAELSELKHNGAGKFTGFAPLAMPTGGN